MVTKRLQCAGPKYSSSTKLQLVKPDFISRFLLACGLNKSDMTCYLVKFRGAGSWLLLPWTEPGYFTHRHESSIDLIMQLEPFFFFENLKFNQEPSQNFKN